MVDIKREASDKIKGITLQKLRALKLAFDTIAVNPNAQLHIAIEYAGDVYLYSENRNFIEENKNYKSRNFSFTSSQVLNTLVYFLDYWLKETIAQSKNVFFSFYSTNEIAKENHTERIQTLGITLPDCPILSILTKGGALDENLMETCRLLILDEYKKQYKGKNNHYCELDQWTNIEWQDFFNQIVWNFGMPDHVVIKKELTQAIRDYGRRNQIIIDGKEEFVRAWLRERLEDDQYESDRTQRFLNNIEIQNIFYKIRNNQIPETIYSFIDEDYSELRSKTLDFTEAFLQSKYNSLLPGTKSPFYLNRIVKKHSNEIRINPKHLSNYNVDQAVPVDIIKGEIGSLIIPTKPNFLFGEIGSGKSSLISQFVIHQVREMERTFIFIPVIYLKGKITLSFEPFLTEITRFVNQNIVVGQNCFDFQMLIRSQQQATLVIDGLDELGIVDIKLILNHLQLIARNYENITVIVTGRPLELQQLVNFNDWNCLTTLELTENEIYQLLKNEALQNGIPNEDEAEIDTQRRLNFLYARKQLFSIAKTPLIVCLIREYLNESLEEESLGTLMYKIICKRLDWDTSDAKSSYSQFFAQFPSTYQREKLVGAIASEIASTGKQHIHGSRLFDLIDKQVGEMPNRNVVVAEAIQFYKNIFLQESDSFYSFISQPLFEIAYGIDLALRMQQPGFHIEIVTTNWRSISFATAICRRKGALEIISTFLRSALEDLLVFEANTPYAASIVSESKDSQVANHYFELISTLKFRPLMIWSEEGLLGSRESYSPYVIADTINLAGETGFNWFFEEYLKPSHPAHHSDESLIAHILKNYLTIRLFQLTVKERELFSGIIPFHIAAKTGWCGEIFSILAIVLPEAFTLSQRYRLVAESVNDRLLYQISRKIIDDGIKSGNLNLILDGLEVETARDHSYSTTSVLLWLELSSGPLNKSVLQLALKLSAIGDKLVFEALEKRIGSKGLKAYLTLIALCLNKGANYAALLLYDKYNITDFYIIARPLLAHSDRSDYSTPQIRKILNDILMTDQNRSLKYFIKFTPLMKNKGETSVLFLYYYLKLLLAAPELYLDHFLYIILHLPKHNVMVRYPEIREGFRKLLESYPPYRESLQRATENLDFRLRFNANNILLACFPEHSIKELENVIRAADKRQPDSQEWIRFCMKLHYSQKTLLQLDSLLQDLSKNSRYYALFILYHQKYSLSLSQKNELVEGLLGQGTHFDHDSSFMNGDGLNSLAQDSQLLPLLIQAFHGNDPNQKINAAHQIYYHQLKNTSSQEKAEIYLLECQDNNWALFNFQQFEMAPFDNPDFLAAFTSVSETMKAENGDYPILYQCYQLVLSPTEELGITILKKLIFRGISMATSEFDLVYRWFKTICKRYPHIAEPIGNAAWKLISVPAINERKDYNPMVYHLAIFASEFSTLAKYELAEILNTYGSQDDVICSLLYRIGDSSHSFIEERSFSSFHNFFAINNTQLFQPIDQKGIENLLVDSSDIPKVFLEGILSCLLYQTGIPDNFDFKTNKTAILFNSIINFCKDETVDFNTLILAADRIGWPFYSNPENAELREAVNLVKEIMLEKQGSYESYVEMLITRIKDQEEERFNEIYEYFKELFKLDVIFPVTLFEILFNVIKSKSYILKNGLLYQVLDYISGKVEEKDLAYLSKLAADHIKSLLSQYEKDFHQNGQVIMLWMFGLICLYIDQKIEPHSRDAYLIGLKAIFISDGGNQHLNSQNQTFRFDGRELLNHSLAIYEKINPEVLYEVMEFGSSNGTPEIKSICKVLRVFSGKNVT